MKLQILVIFALIAACYGMSVKPQGALKAWWNPLDLIADLWNYTTEALQCIIQCLQGNPPKSAPLPNDKNALIDTIIDIADNYWTLFKCMVKCA